MFLLGKVQFVVWIFEKCSSHQLQQTFQKVFTMEMPLQYHFTLLDNQPTSQLMHCCLLTAALFSSALNIPSVRWQRTLYSMWLLLSLLSKQGNFSCPTPVVSELLLRGAASGPVVDGACIGISSSSCQLRTKKRFSLVFKT